MAKAQNIILVENFMVKLVKPASLTARERVIKEIILMFENKNKKDGDKEFIKLCHGFPGNQDGHMNERILKALGIMRDNFPRVFHDYLRALGTAQTMQRGIEQLPQKDIDMFINLLANRPDAKSVKDVFDVKHQKAQRGLIQTFVMCDNRKAPTNYGTAIVPGFLNDRLKEFPHQKALRGRFYLRTILTEMSPEDARQITRSLFTNGPVPDETRQDSEVAFSHQAMRWAAMVVDRKRNALFNFQSIPMPPPAYQQKFLGMTPARVMGVGAIACAMVFAVAAASENPPMVAKFKEHVEQVVQHVLKNTL